MKPIWFSFDMMQLVRLRTAMTRAALRSDRTRVDLELLDSIREAIREMQEQSSALEPEFQYDEEGNN